MLSYFVLGEILVLFIIGNESVSITQPVRRRLVVQTVIFSSFTSYAFIGALHCLDYSLF